MLRLLLLSTTLSLALPEVAAAARIQELCDVRGVRPNQLIGYGLVVGLAGTGDRGQARFTVQSTASMLRRLGATIDPGAIQTKNAAAVIVTATLPAYASPGTRIDVTVSSLGNAKSLQGGTLLQTPLFGADRVVYAVAQGPMLVGGFSAGGRGASVTQNHTTVGRVARGAIVERRSPTPELAKDHVLLQLRAPSFVTAQRMAAAIRERFGDSAAKALNGGTVRVALKGSGARGPVDLLAQIQMLEVEPDAPARVVIDERTGTIVLGAGVRISEIAVAQGGLTVEVVRRKRVSQPGTFSDGDTRVVEDQGVVATQQEGALVHMKSGASLAEVVDALNALGATPRNLIAIFLALQSAGALQAEIEVQ